MYLGSWKLDDLLTFTVVTTRVDTGAATDADSAPAYRVYEDETSTPILTGTMALLDSGNTAGFYSEQITLSAANGFEKGKSYNIYIQATVNSVIGATTRNFQMEAEVDANRLNWANVDNPTTANNLSGTNIDTDQVVASVSGAVGSVTAAVTVGTNNDKTNYSLSAAGIQAIWDALTAALTTVGSIGKRLADNIDAAISSRSTYAGGAVASVTGNVGGNVAGSIGSLAAQAKADVNAEVAAALTTYDAATGSDVPTAIQNADALLTRDLTAVAAPASRSPFNALRKLMNRVALAAGVLTIYQEDDATPAYTQTVTQDANQTPIKSVDTN